jgi:hypothetical protein
MSFSLLSDAGLTAEAQRRREDADEEFESRIFAKADDSIVGWWIDSDAGDIAAAAGG